MTLDNQTSKYSIYAEKDREKEFLGDIDSIEYQHIKFLCSGIKEDIQNYFQWLSDTKGGRKVTISVSNFQSLYSLFLNLTTDPSALKEFIINSQSFILDFGDLSGSFELYSLLNLSEKEKEIFFQLSSVKDIVNLPFGYFGGNIGPLEIALCLRVKNVTKGLSGDIRCLMSNLEIELKGLSAEMEVSNAVHYTCNAPQRLVKILNEHFVYDIEREEKNLYSKFLYLLLDQCKKYYKFDRKTSKPIGFKSQKPQMLNNIVKQIPNFFEFISSLSLPPIDVGLEIKKSLLSAIVQTKLETSKECQYIQYLAFCLYNLMEEKEGYGIIGKYPLRYSYSFLRFFHLLYYYHEYSLNVLFLGLKTLLNGELTPELEKDIQWNMKHHRCYDDVGWELKNWEYLKMWCAALHTRCYKDSKSFDAIMFFGNYNKESLRCYMIKDFSLQNLLRVFNPKDQRFQIGFNSIVPGGRRNNNIKLTLNY